jgi:hypothetical protein
MGKEAGGNSSEVERQLPKLNVAGSIPVSRSVKGRSPRGERFFFTKRNSGFNARYPLTNNLLTHHKLERFFMDFQESSYRLNGDCIFSTGFGNGVKGIRIR